MSFLFFADIYSTPFRPDPWGLYPPPAPRIDQRPGPLDPWSPAPRIDPLATAPNSRRPLLQLDQRPGPGGRIDQPDPLQNVKNVKLQKILKKCKKAIDIYCYMDIIVIVKNI